MSISYLTGYYKIAREHTVSLALKYFDMGDITFTNDVAAVTGQFSPRDYSFEGTYSRMLSENLGVGVTARYISSNLTGAFSGSDAQTGRTVAADVGIFYTRELKSTRGSTLSLGAQISNIGGKISYTDNDNRDFLPTNLRVGGAFKTQLDPFNTITFLLDFNKLMTREQNMSGAKLAAAILMQPQRIPALLRLGRNSARAAAELSRVLRAAVQVF